MLGLLACKLKTTESEYRAGTTVPQSRIFSCLVAAPTESVFEIFEKTIFCSLCIRISMVCHLNETERGFEVSHRCLSLMKESLNGQKSFIKQSPTR